MRVKSLCVSNEASFPGVMFVHCPPEAWTTVPSEPGPDTADVPVRLDATFQPTKRATRTIAIPDPTIAHWRRLRSVRRAGGIVARRLAERVTVLVDPPVAAPWVGRLVAMVGISWVMSGIGGTA